MKIRIITKLIIRIIAGFIAIVILYFISAYSLSYVTVNSDFKECNKDAIEIHITTSGVHTDIVMPYQNQYFDWSSYVKPADTKLKNSATQFVAFGWGDKGFFLETKTWDDIKFSTTFNALFYLSSSAMHVTFHDRLKESESCKKICISKENYIKLANYVIDSFSRDESGMPQLIKGASYFHNDAFYEAEGTYSLFNTCNTWANNGLKAAKLKACLWTPFESGIFRKYQD